MPICIFHFLDRKKGASHKTIQRMHKSRPNRTFRSCTYTITGEEAIWPGIWSFTHDARSYTYSNRLNKLLCTLCARTSIYSYIPSCFARGANAKTNKPHSRKIPCCVELIPRGGVESQSRINHPPMYSTGDVWVRAANPPLITRLET